MPQAKSKPSGIYVVVPAYNEGRALGRVLNDLVALKRSGLIGGILVVNDGSTDGTRKIAEHPFYKENGVEVFNYQKNWGKARATHMGIKWAHGKNAEFFLMLDADLEVVSAEQIRKMREPFKDSEVQMVLGETHVKKKEGGLSRPFFTGVSWPYFFGGQRMIRMSALKPLLLNRKNWLYIIAGIKKEKVNGKIKVRAERRGYGVEEALDYLVAHIGKTRQAKTGFISRPSTSERSVSNKRKTLYSTEPEKATQIIDKEGQKHGKLKS